MIGIYSNPILYRLYLLFVKVKLKLSYLLHQGNLTVKKGDVLIKYNNDGDDQELLYLANWDKYYKEEFPKLKSLIKEGDTVIDVGSNIGFFALMMSKLVGKKGKVYCFEPSTTIFNKLKANLILNNIKNVIIVNRGAGEKEEERIIKRNSKYSGMSSIVLEYDRNLVEEKISLTTLDKYFANKLFRINFIKIDTEGFEPQVLNGAVETLKQHNPIIYIELGGGDFLSSSKQALKFLKDNNFTIAVTDEELETVPAGVNFIAYPNK